MSRSYKKSPVCNDHATPGTIWAKRKAAKAVRRYKDDIASGAAFRKLYCSWNICDYRFYTTRQQVIAEWVRDRHRRFYRTTLEQELQHWEKHFRRK
ncbi:hypothetical protein FHS18_006679 [Paenibacillus phyllosphaerae]|uniref:Uncharacterized protein n=1 Tax=Paenibacillus phyllosphaerae TaxID=274593 RepID=A0A7W5B537_9BACL|nr:hypothetical protein [Paenibacillus phyllosphaerae]MBB3114558.1 hypothetical protein [Paenibacillus phyllosphaerae]